MNSDISKEQSRSVVGKGEGKPGAKDRTEAKVERGGGRFVELQQKVLTHTVRFKAR